jgi:ABC-type enterobactin transport system permease subunit
VLRQVAPFLLARALIALASPRPLNALALGEDAGRALGAHIGRTRTAGVVAVTLLCGAATAAVGPIASTPVFAAQRIAEGARAQQLLDSVDGVDTVRRFGLSRRHLGEVRRRSGDAVE